MSKTSGGGGSRSGGGLAGVKKALPEAATVGKPPALQGTSNQVQWANKIRSEAATDLKIQLKNKYGDAIKHVGSKKEMLDYIKSTSKFWSGQTNNKAVIKEKTAAALNSVQKAAAAVGRYAKVIGHDQAKYWIDRNTNKGKNYGNKYLREWVINGKK